MTIIITNVYYKNISLVIDNYLLSIIFNDCKYFNPDTMNQEEYYNCKYISINIIIQNKNYILYTICYILT